MAPRAKVTNNGQSFITTGGQWIPGCGSGTWHSSEEDHQGKPCWNGAYVGGTREPGRFTSKLAPMSSNPFQHPPRAERVPPAPDYSTPEQVTLRAREGGATAMADWLPLKGEELGVKFVKALRALDPAEWGPWERDPIPYVAAARTVARKQDPARRVHIAPTLVQTGESEAEKTLRLGPSRKIMRARKKSETTRVVTLECGHHRTCDLSKRHTMRCRPCRADRRQTAAQGGKH